MIGAVLCRRLGLGRDGGWISDREDRSVFFLLGSGVKVARRGAIYRLILVSRQRMVAWSCLAMAGLRLEAWRRLGCRSHGRGGPGGDLISLGFLLLLASRYWGGPLCGATTLWWWDSLRRRGSAEGRDGGARGHWTRPWWIAASDPCGEWLLGRAFGLGFLFSLFSSLVLLLVFSLLVVGSARQISNKSMLFRVMVVVVVSGNRIDLGCWLVVRIQSYLVFVLGFHYQPVLRRKGDPGIARPIVFYWLVPILVSATYFGPIGVSSGSIRLWLLDPLTRPFLFVGVRICDVSLSVSHLV
ncbi:hypothetical protein RchiOBHm_Chr4g0410721 [Rosa chinensis]|uniref:Uncharacterized protein n=1 Tax=Rosa chinensis TaxID=74649 RepID=A0A2P6QVG5_ROSCH|nr:hypothetical protein RchiOBHm_Chr4g0410721 [Rosa chinensis]